MPAAADSPLVPELRRGDRIGPYRVFEQLGSGGVAVVYRALHEPSGREVALKTARTRREELMASLRSEMRALKRLAHPGVVKLFESGVQDGYPWYAMERLEGATLREHLRGRLESSADPTERDEQHFASETRLVERVRITSASPSTPRAKLSWFLTIMRRVCEPLAYIHGEGLVHRDLTPSNVFVRSDDTPVLMDFGLVWHLLEQGSREVMSVERVLAGTIAYMAPEQALGQRLDARADLFALGSIMYEGITGRAPYPGDSWSQLIASHRGPPPAPPSSLVSGVPPELDALVLGLLQTQPRDRIGHARDVAAALADLGAEDWPRGDRPEPKAYLYRPRLVGRNAALKQARIQLERLAEGRGGFGFVTGESGIGKTCFVSEIARQAELHGIAVICGQCSAVGMVGHRGIGRNGPLYPLTDLLLAVADRCLAQGPASLPSLLGNRAKILAAVEPSLRQLPGVEHEPEPAEVPGDAARRRLIDALQETIAAFVAGQPTLLVLEDLQWADDVTLAFLATRSAEDHETQSLWIIGTYRSEEQSPALQQLGRLPHVVTFPLEPLQADEVGAMAAEMLGQREVTTELASSLDELSSGNPFFAAEYLRAAVDEKVLYRDARGSWQSQGGTRLHELDLPHDLGALVARRLDQLSPTARRLAEVAAVFGRELEIEILHAVAGASEPIADTDLGFEESLRELTLHQILENSAEGRVRFVHDKLREITYEGLAAERRSRLHSACADLLEARLAGAEVPGAELSVLAHHYEHAGQLEKARRYYDLAGAAAHAMHANQESSKLLLLAQAQEQLLGERSGSSRLARSRRARLLGLNALALGNVNQAFAALAEAASIAGRPWPSTRLRLVGRCCVAPLELLAQRARNLGRSTQAPEAERELLLEAARAYERLLVVNYFMTGDQLGVMLAALTNVVLTERAGGPSAERALGYAAFAAMLTFLRLDRVARTYCQYALDVGRESGDEVAQSWVLMNVALVHLQAGRWSEMRACLEQVDALARATKFSRRWEECTIQFSTGCMLKGDLREAERLNDALLGAVQRADPQSQCWAVVRRAELALLAGDFARARSDALKGEEICHQNLARGEWVYALGALALAHWRCGEHDEACAAAERCVTWIETGSAPVFYHVFAYASVAEVRLAAWQLARGTVRERSCERAARKAFKLLSSLAHPIAVARPRAALWRGFEAQLLDGRPKRAAKLFRRSLRHAQELQMPYDEALALAALGRYGCDGPSAGAAQLQRAIDILERVGARYDRELVRGWAEALRAGASKGA